MDIPAIPETAPFSEEQRAWLNGFFAGLLGDGGKAPGAPVNADAAADPEEDHPWHDAALSLGERLALAAEAKPARRLMAAMAQLDCGQCGYLCKTYAEAVWSGTEASMSRCVPGGKETQRTLKKLLEELEPLRGSEPVAAPVARSGASALKPGSHRDMPALATLVEAHPLSRKGSAKDVRHVVFELTGSGVEYKVGDSLGVFPRKNPLLVQAVLDRLGATGEEIVGFAGGALPLRQVLLSKVDIARPSDAAIEFLASRAFDATEAIRLHALSQGAEDAALAEADLLDLLLAFPSVQPSLAGLIATLEPLQPRLYSISSSPKAHPNEVHLTVSAVRWTVRARNRTGVGSCYLADIASPGDVVPVFVQAAHGFAPPADPTLPVIMVGPGTGVAPFRAFLEEREAVGATGKNWLLFGDQRRATDFLYEEQLTDWARRGHLARLDLAFSRDQEAKIYVQDRLRENASEVWRWLGEGGHVYVCGDAKRMALDVERALTDIVAAEGDMAPDAARRWLGDLTKAGRYQKDVY